MKPDVQAPNGVTSHLVRVRPEAPDQFTAQVVGLPEVRATAASREAALHQVRQLLQEWLSSGQLVMVEVSEQKHSLQGFGSVDPNDPNEQAYLEELERMRQEDLEQTLREHGQECSDS